MNLEVSSFFHILMPYPLSIIIDGLATIAGCRSALQKKETRQASSFAQKKGNKQDGWLEIRAWPKRAL